jgi:predicted phage tail protein
MKTAALILLALPHAAPAAEIKLAWNANPEPNVVRYQVIYGEAGGALATTLSAGNSTTATVSGLTPGVTYHFAVIAINAAGLSSEPSEPVSGTATVKPRRIIQYSEDLIYWQDVQILPGPQPPHAFLRFKFESPD